jgi:hypothetical protein
VVGGLLYGFVYGVFVSSEFVLVRVVGHGVYGAVF